MKVIAILRSDDSNLEHICSSKEKCIEYMKNKLKYYLDQGEVDLWLTFNALSVHPSWYLEGITFRFYEIEVDSTDATDISSTIVSPLVRFIQDNGWDYIDYRNPRAIINGREVPLSQKYPQ